MNEVKAKQELIQFKAKKELFELNIEVNGWGPVERFFLRGCIMYLN
jgi:hypothetical protein